MYVTPSVSSWSLCNLLLKASRLKPVKTTSESSDGGSGSGMASTSIASAALDMACSGQKTTTRVGGAGWKGYTGGVEREDEVSTLVPRSDRGGVAASYKGGNGAGPEKRVAFARDVVTCDRVL